MSAAADVGINGTVMRSISKTIRPALGCRLRFSAFAPITQNVVAVCYEYTALCRDENARLQPF
jgi:hypothetical protein